MTKKTSILAKISTFYPLFSLIIALGTQSLFPSTAHALTKEALRTPKALSAAMAADALVPEAPVKVVVPAAPKPDKEIAAVITAYSSTPGQTDSDPFTAASGKRVYDGMVANNCLPFGTKLKFPELYGDKEFTVDDRMNSRYGCNRFDIWLDAPIKEVNQFGVKRKVVEVYLKKKTPTIAKTKKTAPAKTLADAQ